MSYSIFKQGWKTSETISGYGSTLEFTEGVRNFLPEAIERFNIRSINDAGCGDLAWVRQMDLGQVDYHGYDVAGREVWKSAHGFPCTVMNIAEEDMRPCDLIICRDVFIHLDNRAILKSLDRFRRVGNFLLSTSFDRPPLNDRQEIEQKYFFENEKRIKKPDLHHSKLDLRGEPFNLGEPMVRMEEKYSFKYMGLWKLES